MSNLTYISHPTGYEIYIKNIIQNEEQKSGAIELVIAHLIDYLTQEFPNFKQSSTGGTHVTFTYSYPQDVSLEYLLPVVALSTRDDEHYQDSMGYIQYYNKYTGDVAYGVQIRTTIEFDIWARSPREKAFIQGILLNMLHAGFVNNKLRFRGLQSCEFVRSIPRGYDQTDRVLQFHTHQIGSDEIFRQIMEFDFIYDSRLIWDFANPGGLVYAIRHIITDIGDDQFNIRDNVAIQSTKILIS